MFSRIRALSICIPLCSGDRFHKHTTNNAAFLQKLFWYLFAYSVWADKHFDPIFRLTAFFESNMKFVYKIRLACGIVRFVNVCTNRGRTSYNLINSTPRPLRVSISSQTAIICKARAIALVRKFRIFHFYFPFWWSFAPSSQSEVVRYAHSEVKFAPK